MLTITFFTYHFTVGIQLVVYTIRYIVGSLYSYTRGIISVVILGWLIIGFFRATFSSFFFEVISASITISSIGIDYFTPSQIGNTAISSIWFVILFATFFRICTQEIFVLVTLFKCFTFQTLIINTIILDTIGCCIWNSFTYILVVLYIMILSFRTTVSIGTQVVSFFTMYTFQFSFREQTAPNLIKRNI